MDAGSAVETAIEVRGSLTELLEHARTTRAESRHLVARARQLRCAREQLIIDEEASAGLALVEG